MRGFTLIELLIVIAIVGILASGVIVSIGNQTGRARDASVKKGVSSLRVPAITATDVDGKTGVNICNEVYDKVSGEKDDWYWSAGTMCNRDTLVDANGLTATGQTATTGGIDGDLCCMASGTKWVVWGGLDGADGFGTNSNGKAADNSVNKSADDIYCADSNGFLGNVNLAKAVTSLLKTGSDIFKCE